ncbi:hypothetical protein [Helicobacter felis]|uniref:hypothetical protein n=1 Tax=Helicobacter felis TaxID=214 RepID=UPI0013053A80|nr:hypothetical protein [Helicobacter felis]
MLSFFELEDDLKPKYRDFKAECPHRITIMVAHDRSFLPGVGIGFPGIAIL